MSARVDGYLPLRDYAVLGNGQSCALVGRDGAIDWWALPSMADAPAFGALLDVASGGRFTVQPVDDFESTRRYVDDGGVLETTFRTATGLVRVTDALTVSEGAPSWNEFARRIECLEGEVSMTWHVAPGDRFAATAPWCRTSNGTPLISLGGLSLAVVTDSVGEPQTDGGRVEGRFTAVPGVAGLLAVIATQHAPVAVPTKDEVERHIDETIGHWSRWRQGLGYKGPWPDAVCRSAVVLNQLTFWESGLMQAAATTSLPERIGGSRNYDYRFCWVRDAGFALDALINLGVRRDVHATLTGLLSAVANTTPDVQVFYTIRGEVVPHREDQVPRWSGYRNTRPVRIGNRAVSQRQLGVYGDLLECVHRYVEHGNLLDGSTGRLVFAIADQVCEQWRLPDSGIWELDERKQYTISKIACWTALDRAIRLAERGQAPIDHLDRWRGTATAIHQYVDTACWSRSKRSYSFYAGGDELDCATLLAARTGFCSPDDPRLHATIDAVRSELSAGGPLLYRYSGMRENEGAFVACSFWLVEAMVHAGRLEEAHELMDAMLEQVNDVGLLSEEIDPSNGELLGNFPQALSHLALISAATTFAGANATG